MKTPAMPLPLSIGADHSADRTKMYVLLSAADGSYPIRTTGPDAALDAAYIVQAANAYPKLVEALRDADTRERMYKRINGDIETNNSTLLRELGEAA